MLTTYSVLKADTSPPLNLSLSTYEGSSVYYRAGDNNFQNLEPTFVTISKKNHANVGETSSKNNIINGEIIKIMLLF